MVSGAQDWTLSPTEKQKPRKQGKEELSRALGRRSLSITDGAVTEDVRATRGPASASGLGGWDNGTGRPRSVRTYTPIGLALEKIFQEELD